MHNHIPTFSAKRLKKAGRQSVNGASAPETPALEGEEQPAAETPEQGVEELEPAAETSEQEEEEQPAAETAEQEEEEQVARRNHHCFVHAWLTGKGVSARYAPSTLRVKAFFCTHVCLQCHDHCSCSIAYHEAWLPPLSQS
jgi:primosomal protein N'